MFDNSYFFWTYIWHNGIPIFLNGCQASLSGRQMFKWGCPPGAARSQFGKSRHFGVTNEKSSEKSLLSLLYEGDQVFCGKKIRGRFLQKKVRSAILYRRETGDPRNCLEEWLDYERQQRKTVYLLGAYGCLRHCCVYCILVLHQRVEECKRLFRQAAFHRVADYLRSHTGLSDQPGL